MSQYVDTNTKSFRASGPIGDFLRVKLDANGEVELAGAGAADEDAEIGTTEVPTPTTVQAEAEGRRMVTVRLRSAAGTARMIADGAVAVGAEVYGAAGGKVSTTVSGGVLGTAMHAVSADGDVLEVLRK